MSEQLGGGFVPEFDFNVPSEAPHFYPEQQAPGGSTAPFGYRPDQSLPVQEDRNIQGAAELRTSLKTREDTTSGEHLPF